MKIYLKLEAPYEWARVVGSSVEAFGEVQAPIEYPIGDAEEVIGVVPGEWVTTHEVTLPTKTRKQFNQALPFALEDSIAEDISNIHFVCPQWRVGSSVRVLSVSRDRMRAWQELANANKLPVTQLLPDYALIPFHEAAECSIAVSDNMIVARDSELGGVTIDENLVETWLMEIPVATTVAVNDEALTQSLIENHPNRDFRHWPFGSKMRHWLEYEVNSSIDLWGDTYRPRVSLKGNSVFVKPALLAAFAVLMFFGYEAYRYFSLRTEIQRLDQQMLQTLNEAVPGAQGISGGEARKFMQTAISRGQARNSERGVHEALADASLVLKRMNASLIELNYQNEELVLRCVLNDFSQVDALTKQFNSRRALTASLQGSSAEDGKVIATYSLREAN